MQSTVIPRITQYFTT